MSVVGVDIRSSLDGSTKLSIPEMWGHGPCIYPEIDWTLWTCIVKLLHRTLLYMCSSHTLHGATVARSLQCYNIDSTSHTIPLG